MKKLRFKKAYFNNLSGLLFLFIMVSCTSSKPDYVQAPFSGLDVLSTNDWWNREANEILNLKVPREEVVAF